MPSTTKTETNKSLIYITHLIYWPIYLTLLFPIHACIKFALYFTKHLEIVALFNMVMAYRYLYFVTPKERFKIFIRNSWILTPSDFIPWVMDKKEYNSDHTVERRSTPHNWEQIRRQTYKDDDYTCQCCEVKSGPHGGDVELHADHVMPVSRDGNDTQDNLRTLCRMCHQARHCRFFD